MDPMVRGSRYSLHALIFQERCSKCFLGHLLRARDRRFGCDIDSARTAPVYEYTGKTIESLALVIGEP